MPVADDHAVALGQKAMSLMRVPKPPSGGTAFIETPLSIHSCFSGLRLRALGSQLRIDPGHSVLQPTDLFLCFILDRHHRTAPPLGIELAAGIDGPAFRFDERLQP